MIPKRTGEGKTKKNRMKGVGARQRGGFKHLTTAYWNCCLGRHKRDCRFRIYVHIYICSTPAVPLLILFSLPSRLGIGFRRLLCRDYVFTV
ncbi:hypothetical protein CEXT_36161 [Caerostris extrusa]|uniref:Uncharacterized protein n=1 Tax=Caerostris extrusa TaxID=172846 RepID=A0AAV4ME46_CAEEX|nr:hypothetical protein CEXT_36161 [Caerostris extrusa]